MIATLPQPLSAAALLRHHVATPAAPLPAPQPGITWIFAANGLKKRGVDQRLDLLVHASGLPAVPGLASLMPHVRFAGVHRRLPSHFLSAALQHAQRCASTDLVARPIEQQYLVVREAARLRVLVPTQQATATQVRYQVPAGAQVLLDLHSHHDMPAYFSLTDDRDDTGLSVSAVIGRIFSEPTIVCRLNCYGARQLVPATLIFDGLGPFRDGGSDADAHD